VEFGQTVVVSDVYLKLSDPRSS